MIWRYQKNKGALVWSGSLWVCDRRQSTDDAGIRFLLLSSPGPQNSAALGCSGLFFKGLKARGMTSLFIRKKKKNPSCYLFNLHMLVNFFLMTALAPSFLSSAQHFWCWASCTGLLSPSPDAVNVGLILERGLGQFSAAQKRRAFLWAQTAYWALWFSGI